MEKGVGKAALKGGHAPHEPKKGQEVSWVSGEPECQDDVARSLNREIPTDVERNRQILARRVADDAQGEGRDVMFAKIGSDRGGLHIHRVISSGEELGFLRRGFYCLGDRVEVHPAEGWGNPFDEE